MKEIILEKIPSSLIRKLSLEYKNIIYHENHYVNLDEEIVIPISDIKYPIMIGIDQYDRAYISPNNDNYISHDIEEHILYNQYRDLIKNGNEKGLIKIRFLSMIMVYEIISKYTYFNKI